MDLPGYGKSYKPNTILNIAQLADALARWMDATKIANASWVANSFGCQILAEFALRHRERVDRLVLQGPTVDPSARSLPRQIARLMVNSGREGASLGRWQPPRPDTDSPEAEWGFEPSLAADVESFAARHGLQIRRVVFDSPEQMSPLVADLYDWWNKKRNVREHRLLVESFIVMEPYWTIRTGSVPFWMVFNKQPSAEALKAYLAARRRFDDAHLMLFSHGVDSIGLVAMDEWGRILEAGGERTSFIGVDKGAYPRDFAVFVRYHEDLVRNVKSRYPIPPPLSLAELEDFLSQFNNRYQVQWH